MSHKCHCSESNIMFVNCFPSKCLIICYKIWQHEHSKSSTSVTVIGHDTTVCQEIYFTALGCCDIWSWPPMISLYTIPICMYMYVWWHWPVSPGFSNQVAKLKPKLKLIPSQKINLYSKSLLFRNFHLLTYWIIKFCLYSKVIEIDAK